MRQSQAFSGLRVPYSLRILAGRFFRRALHRRVVCCAVALNLLLWPGPGLFTENLLAVASEVLNTRVGSQSYEAYFLGRLFSRFTARPRRETMADRAAVVANIRLNPMKLVGYENEGSTFTAVPSDFLGRTVQGVKFSWESSNTATLEIDDSGRARFLEAGLAWVTCRAGTATSTAPVLIRPNHRPRQSDVEWRIDQQRLRVNGEIVGQTDGSKGIGSALASSKKHQEGSGLTLLTFERKF